MTEGPEDWTRQRIEAELKSDVPNITIEDGLWLLERCRPCVKCGRYPATICQGNYDIMEEGYVTAQKELDRLHAEGPRELLARVQNYLGNGGLFNPEAMDHDKVRALVMDLAAALSAFLSTTSNGTPARSVAVGQPAADAPGEIIRGKASL